MRPAPRSPLPDPQGETTTLILVCSDASRCCVFYITGVRRCSACSTKRIPQRVSFLCLASCVHGDLGDSSSMLGAAVSGSPQGYRGLWGGKGPRVWSGLVGQAQVVIWPRAGGHPGASIWVPSCTLLQGNCTCVSRLPRPGVSRGEQQVCLVQ